MYFVVEISELPSLAFIAFAVDLSFSWVFLFLSAIIVHGASGAVSKYCLIAEQRENGKFECSEGVSFFFKERSGFLLNLEVIGGRGLLGSWRDVYKWI